MTEKALNKRLRSKVAMHMLFGLGGAVVIIGALFKILVLSRLTLEMLPRYDFSIRNGEFLNLECTRLITSNKYNKHCGNIEIYENHTQEDRLPAA